MREFAQQQGYLCFAQNTDSVDYLRLAYAQALSIKCTQKINNYAVIVDQETAQQIQDHHRLVFDHVIVLEQDDAKAHDWKLANEWQAYDLTPFRETIKLESDILFTRNIDHWWAGMRIKEVTFTTHVRDYRGQISKCRDYRRLFDENQLPNVYNGMFYFRHSQTARDLFNAAAVVYQNWPVFRDSVLIRCNSENATTDEAFAIATKLIGEDRVTNPALDYLSFVHMKGAINGLGLNDDWTQLLFHQWSEEMNLQIEFLQQQYPVHYYQKEFVTDQLIGAYEQRLSKLNSSL
jgi:hypothetical protein